jgi:hypothetical protein
MGSKLLVQIFQIFYCNGMLKILFQVEINTILEGVQEIFYWQSFLTTIWGGPQAQNRFDGTIV